MVLSKFAYGTHTAPNRRKYVQLSEFLEAVWLGNIGVVEASLGHGAVSQQFLEEVDPLTGMNCLHLAVGRNNLEMTKALVTGGAAFVPDREGRMPSVIAAEMEVSEELADYIYEAESRALQAQGQEDV